MADGSDGSLMPNLYVRPDKLDAPGHFPKGAEYEAVLDFLDIINDAWTTDASATPTWTASAGTPAIGDGTLSARYKLLGKTRPFQIRLVWGTTTTGGTAGATWQFTVPGGGTVASDFDGSGHVFDTSANAIYTLTWRVLNGGTVIRMWRNDASPSVEMVNNFITFASGDVIVVSGTIEVT